MECKSDKQKLYMAQYRVKNSEYYKKYREDNKDYRKEKDAEQLEDLKKHIIDSVEYGSIIDSNKWNLWCSRLKGSAKKHPYSEDFTNDIIFKMMTKGCYYCGDIAMGIDRKVSMLDHTPDNCVASCRGCNISKGASDQSTFIRKSYYRSRGKYVDDIVDIWFDYKTKPRIEG